MITAFLALVASLWTGATVEALTRTAAPDSVVMVAGRTFVTSSSIRLWLAAGGGAGRGGGGGLSRGEVARRWPPIPS